MTRVLATLALAALLPAAASADDYAVKDRNGATITFAAVLLNGKLYPKVMPVDASGNLLFSSGNPGYFAVTGVVPLPTGAATKAAQDAAQVTLAAIQALLGGTLTVSAPGQATGAKQDAAQATLAAIQALLGGTLTVSAPSLPLPAGAATGTAQATGNASLTSIDGKTPALVNGRVPVDGSGVTQPVIVLPFAPLRPQTYVLAAGPTATTAPVQLPAVAGATSYRVRNPVSSASPITWTLASNGTTPPVLPTAYSTAGAGGVAGDKTVDPGGVEVFSLSSAQQAALAAGTLYWSAITPASGSGTLSITFGNGG